MSSGVGDRDSSTLLAEAYTNFATLQDALGKEVSQLWDDVWNFLIDLRPRPGARQMTPGRRRRLVRAAVLTAAAAFEAVTNYLSDQLLQAGEVHGNKLTEAEMGCLREKRKCLEGGRITERKQLYSSKDRFMLLFALFLGGKDLGEDARAQLQKSFLVRDELVHPKPGISPDARLDSTVQDVILGFWTADLLLAQVWAKSKVSGRSPHVGVVGSPRVAEVIHSGEATHGEGKI